MIRDTYSQNKTKIDLFIALVFASSVIFLQGSDEFSYDFGEFDDNQDQTFPDFNEVSEDKNLVHNSSEQQFIDMGVNGAYLTDFNRNGFDDILANNGNEVIFFENINGSFQERGFLSEYSDVMSTHFLDYDNSGYEDLLLLKRNQEPVFLKNNDGVFEEKDVGISERLIAPYGAVSADFNKNGCLDLFIYQWEGPTGLNNLEIHRNHPDIRPKSGRSGYENIFYKGNCDKFSEATDSVGIHDEETNYQTLAASFVDLTGNNYPDIHLGNDFSKDIIYRNNGDGTFSEIDMGPSSDRNAMSSNIADISGNLKPDIFVTNIHYDQKILEDNIEHLFDTDVPLPYGNNLFINRGDGEFEDKASSLGVSEGGWGWSAEIADFNNDGKLSILHANSYSQFPFNEPKGDVEMKIFTRDKERYEEVYSPIKGFEPQNSRGLVSIDYNRNGKIDLVKTIYSHFSAADSHQSAKDNYIKLYENTNNDSKYVQFTLDGKGYIETNTEFYLETNKKTHYRILDSGSDYMVQNSPFVHFGLENKEIKSLRIHFPDGETINFSEFEYNKRYMINRSEEELNEI